MTNGADDLFAGKKASKAGGISISILHNLRRTIFPADTLCTWKQIFQQFLLVAELNFNVSIAESRRTPTLIDSVDSVRRLFSIFSRSKLHKTVHRLSSGTFHDYVYCVAWNKSCLSANKLEDLLLGDGIGDLAQG